MTRTVPGSGAEIFPVFNSIFGVRDVYVINGGEGYDPNDPPRLRIGNCGTPIRDAVLRAVVEGDGGVNASTDNPTVFVYRGFTYKFKNITGAAHPFALRQTSGGTAVTEGVSGSNQGTQYWTVPMALAAGTTYVYQCTLHPAMVGNLTVV